MTTDKLLTTLEAALIGESSKCWVDVYAVQLAVDKIKAAEELAKKSEDVCMRRTVFTEQLGMALENYRAAGETE